MAEPQNDPDLAKEILTRVQSVLGHPDEFVPLHEPEFLGAEWDMVKDCLDSGWVSSVGKYVDRFEEQVADLCGARFSVAVSNGTAALQVALIVAGVEPGDEVLMPALTFVATANAAAHAGAIPHFVDCSAATLGLDPEKLDHHLANIAEQRGETLINRDTGRRIGAIIPMHTFGHPVAMDGLLAVANRFGIPVVEDAAEALGSTYDDRACGALSLIGAVSFNGNKIVTTGGGGAIVTNDAALAKRAKHLTTTAKLPHPYEYDHDEIGFNYRLPNLNAALGCAQLNQLGARLAAKRKLARSYIDGFSTCSGARVFEEPSGGRSNYWLNALLLDKSVAQHRNTVLDTLNEAGLMARPVWKPLHRLPMYNSAPRADLSVTEDLAARIINLPSSAKLAAA